MRLTNKHDLPQTLINLYHKQRREYSETRKNTDVSVTQIINSPRIDILRKHHYRQMEDDVSNRLWAILGTVIHRIMEDGADEEHIAEENLVVNIRGWNVKGGIDVQRKGNHVSILDYKFTKSFKYEKKDFRDWEEQLNCYAYLLREAKGLYVDSLQVIMFVRDFTQSKADVNPNYPQASAIPIDIPLWTKEEQQKFIEERILLHQDARRAFEWGEPLPHCTDKDRWLRPGTYAVKKKQNKKATKVFEDKADAVAFMTEKNDPDYELVHRQDGPIRCMQNWCGVSKWCDQWKVDKGNWIDETKSS